MSLARGEGRECTKCRLQSNHTAVNGLTAVCSEVGRKGFDGSDRRFCAIAHSLIVGHDAVRETHGEEHKGEVT